LYSAYPTAPAAGEARVHYKELCAAMDASPIKVDIFEKFLAGVDSAVRHAYQGAGFGDNERPAPEKELLVNSRIPAVLVSAVATLLRQTVPALEPEIDRMAVYTADYSWLGFGSDRRTELYRRTHEVDVVKKIPLRRVPGRQRANSTGKRSGHGTATATTSISLLKGGKPEHNGNKATRRRCVRCCEVSGDVGPPRSFLWLRMIVKLGLLRSCLCGGMWALDSNNNQWEAEHAASGQSNMQTGANRTDNSAAAAVAASILGGVT
jgi:mediator of RNA polymerase II transcription subunit 16